MNEIPNVDRRNLLLKALQTVEDLKARLRESEQAASEPIAIVGLGCRFPGDVTGPDSYWKLLDAGVDAVREIPASRWTSTPCPEAAVWKAGLVDGLDRFEPRFFGLSAREASTLDPQQRMVLEVAWEALEHAGIDASRLAGSATGVFIGITGHDYGQLIRDTGRMLLDVYTATGTARKRRRRPAVVCARASGSIRLHRYRLFVLLDCRSPRLPEPPNPRIAHGVGRRRQCRPHTRPVHLLRKLGHDGARRSMQGLRRSRRRLRPLRRLRHRRAQAAVRRTRRRR